MEGARADPPLRIFISSTSQDLHDHRAVAKLAVQDLGWAPIAMEHWQADTDLTLQACYKELDPCDLVVLLVAFRQGTVPPPERGGNGQDSITALELARARERGIPVLAFLASDNWPRGLSDMEPDKCAWVERFRKALSDQPDGFFDPEQRVSDEQQRFPLFRATVRSSLEKFRIDRERARAARAPPPGIDYTERARRALAGGRCIPLLGTDLYAAGPLSVRALIAAFGSPASVEPSFPAAAECLSDYLDDRAAFLTTFGDILEAQSRQSTPPPVHDLLLRSPPPPLLVSFTCDLLLERRLAAAGPLALITHVVRSSVVRAEEQAEPARGAPGQVAIIRSLEDPTQVSFHAPDAIGDVLKAGGGPRWVVYKPLGSPTLHRLFPEDYGVDTVVATEADHLRLLALLPVRSTGIPTAFYRPIQRNPFLFLGYPLDAWNYRLLLNVLQSVERVQPEGAPSTPAQRSIGVAVRAPSSPLEEIAWARLGIDLVRTDPNDFARSIEPARAGS